MVDLTIKRRQQHETVRPAINIPIKTWNDFTAIHRTSEERNNIIEQLLTLQINTNIIIVY